MVKDKRTKKQREAIIDEALKRFDIAKEAWSEVFQKWVEDVRFVDDDEGQWEEKLLTARKGRPNMTFDKVSGALNQIIGAHLQNRPAVKVRGAEEDDDDVQEIYEGLIRQIEKRGKNAYSTGFKYTIKGGFGAWRVRHDYLDDESMDQDIILEEIKNPLTVLLDPIIQVDKLEKCKYGFEFEDIPKEEFESSYPKAKSEASENWRLTGTMHEWLTKDTVRVANYYRVVTTPGTLYQLSDGSVVNEDSEEVLEELEMSGITVINQRPVERKRLECFKITALEVLEEVDCAGRYVPLVPVFGKTSVVDGKFVTRGVVRKAKDPQRLYNYERSSYVETVALQPKQPFLATPKMLKGHEEEWRNINTSNDPVLLFSFDNGQGPQRQSPQMPSQGLLAGLQMSSDDIKSTTGIFDASLGARSNETSGRAIRERKMEGDTANYEFTDELAEAIEHTGKIFVDLIPKIYDSTRQLRILGEDEAEEIKAINKDVRDLETGEIVTINDLSKGKYDVVVTVGPAYSSRKSETAEQLGQIIAQNPEMGAVLGDIYYKSLDIVGADELVKRVRKIGIKQGFIEPNEEEQQELAQANQQENQMQQQMVQLQMALKQAELANEQADAKETESKTVLNMVKAQVEQLQLAQAQQDAQAQQIAVQRLLSTLGQRPAF